MPSSPDPLGGNELQAAGENLNVWGAPKLNQVITNLAFMIAGRSAYTCNGSYTPTTTNYVANEFRAFIHDVSGTGGTVTMPSRSFVKVFRNQCTAAITVTCGGIGASVAAGATSIVWSDGTDCRRFWDSDAGGARVRNVGAPTATTDAATKKYVDDTAFGSIGNLPGLTGNRGRFLQVNNAETNAQWDVGWEIKSADFIAAPGGRYAVNTSGGPVTVTLWSNPVVGDSVKFADAGFTETSRGWNQNNMTINRAGQTIQGKSEDLTCNVRGMTFGVFWNGTGFQLEGAN